MHGEKKRTSNLQLIYLKRGPYVNEGLAFFVAMMERSFAQRLFANPRALLLA